MHRWLPILAVTVLTLAACGSRGAPPPTSVVRAAESRATAEVSPQDARALADGNAEFAGRLLALLARSQSTVALSPYSISETLAMTYAGAHGRTAAQIAQALHFALPPGRLFPAFNALDQSLARVNSGDTKLRSASALFGQRGTAFRQAFLQILARYYGTGVRTVDYSAAPDRARAAINAWVSRETGGKITQLLAHGEITPLTRLVLTNAVYLKARWASPFTAQDTSPAPFHAPGGTVQVPTMHQRASFGYASHPGYRILELPYRDNRLAFDILLPDPGALKPLLTRLADQGPLRLLAGLEPQQVQLSLPKLLLRTRFELGNSLATLGMPLAFVPGQADFSGIADPPGQLSLQHVVHEAYIRVDEAGTEAAAATGAVAIATAVPPQPAIAFDVDRPFVFVLRDTATQAILFLGIVSQP